METLHAEGQSPFVPLHGPDPVNGSEFGPSHMQSNEDYRYVECPVDGCGEVLLLDDVDDHVELHAVEIEGDMDTDSQLQHGSPRESRPGDENVDPGAATPTTSRDRRERDRERDREQDRQGQKSPSPAEESSRRQAKAVQGWKSIFHMSSPRRRLEEASTEASILARRLGVGYSPICARKRDVN